MPGDHVRIYEVGPRDGLQNEASPIPTAAKRRFIELLVDAGLREIEATSFVSPSAIPQLADADALLPSLPRIDGIRYPVLVPNVRGLDRAAAAGADAIAVFTAATDAFTTRNIRMTVDESLAAFAPVVAGARERGWWVRGYVSTAFGCPYSGAVEPARAVAVARRLRDIGVDEVCFGDTIGVAVPDQVTELAAVADRAGFAPRRSPTTSTTRVARRSPTSWRDSRPGCGPSMRPPAGPAAVRTRPARPATSPPRTSCISSTARATSTATNLDKVLVAARFIAGALARPLASKVGQAGGWDAATGAATGRA